jgi:hypothetical protein
MEVIYGLFNLWLLPKEEILIICINFENEDGYKD